MKRLSIYTPLKNRKGFISYLGILIVVVMIAMLFNFLINAYVKRSVISTKDLEFNSLPDKDSTGTSKQSIENSNTQNAATESVIDTSSSSSIEGSLRNKIDDITNKRYNEMDDLEKQLTK